MKHIEQNLIKKLQSGNFTTLEINDWFLEHEFEYIYSTIEGCDKVINYEILYFISTYAEYLLSHPQTSKYETAEEIRQELQHLGHTKEQTDLLSYEALILTLTNSLSKIYEDIITKIIIVGSNHYEEYQSIIKPFCYSPNETIRLYCCANLNLNTHDFSHDPSARIQKISNIRTQFAMWWNSPNITQEEKLKINYLLNAIKYGVLKYQQTNIFYPESNTTTIKFSSFLLQQSESPLLTIDKDILLIIKDKRIFGYYINKMLEEKNIQFKEGFTIPSYHQQNTSASKHTTPLSKVYKL